jgi:hypothetical protein
LRQDAWEVFVVSVGVQPCGKWRTHDAGFCGLRPTHTTSYGAVQIHSPPAQHQRGQLATHPQEQMVPQVPIMVMLVVMLVMLVVMMVMMVMLVMLVVVMLVMAMLMGQYHWEHEKRKRKGKRNMTEVQSLRGCLYSERGIVEPGHLELNEHEAGLGTEREKTWNHRAAGAPASAAVRGSAAGSISAAR